MRRRSDASYTLGVDMIVNHEVMRKLELEPYVETDIKDP